LQAKLRADLAAAQSKASAAAADIDQLTADFQKLARENQVPCDGSEMWMIQTNSHSSLA
jgi:hypothetical protein